MTHFGWIDVEKNPDVYNLTSNFDAAVKGIASCSSPFAIEIHEGRYAQTTNTVCNTTNFRLLLDAYIQIVPNRHFIMNTGTHGYGRYV